MTTPRRIFIECSATARRGGNTGIQRVVRNIVNESEKTPDSLGIVCQPVFYHFLFGFKGIDRLPAPPRFALPEWLLKIYRSLRRCLAIVLLVVARLLAPFLPGQKRRMARQVLRHQGIRGLLRVISDKLRLLGPLRRLKYRAWKVLRHLAYPIRRWCFGEIRIGAGDVLFLLDTGLAAQYWDEVREAQARGALIGIAVYDLIPMKHPECVDEHTIREFTRWWNTASRIADFVVCISKSIWDEVTQELSSPAVMDVDTKAVAGGSWRLGAELDGEIRDKSVRPRIRGLFEQSSGVQTYLMVGQISPRKNYELALDAFEHIWRDNSPSRLVIVGKYGWKSDELVRRIHASHAFDEKLFWFDDVGDGELGFCYRNAAALITTSYAEGFNLPIVESLSRGCPVIASNLPVHQEVGGEFAMYFPARDAAALAGLLCKFERSGVPASIRPTADFNWPNWSESCAELLERIVVLSSEKTAQQEMLGRKRAA